MNISSNVSSLQNNQSLLNTSANNIANINSGSSKGQADLAKEIPNQIVAQRASDVNVQAIKAQDDVMGTLLDIKV